MKKQILFVLSILLPLLSCNKTKTSKIFFYLGTSDEKLEYPIKLCELDLGNETINLVDSFSGSISPTYLSLSPGNNFLFSGSRSSGNSEGQINSYLVDKETYRLSFHNNQPSKGIGPAHLSVHPNGKTLFVANYTSSTVASLPIDNEGKVKPATSVFQHEGNGPNKNRQASAHAHFISSDPSERYVLSVDLGTDKVYIYVYNKDKGIIEPNKNQEHVQMIPGSGPRHLVFHPSGTWFYVINELNSSLSACSFDTLTGRSKVIRTISTLPENIKAVNYPSAIRIHQNGKFLYGSNRGHNSIALFKIDDEGMPEFIETTPTEGDWPRDFNIDPSGRYLIVANQRSNNLSVFRVNQENGSLESMGIKKETSEPTCVLFAKKKYNIRK